MVDWSRHERSQHSVCRFALDHGEYRFNLVLSRMKGARSLDLSGQITKCCIVNDECQDVLPIRLS